MKVLKIIGWTLLSLVLVVLLAIGVAIYWVFTPERLTPIVSNVATSVLTCESHIDEVELTFFSTFPRFGLKASNLLLINPTEGAQSDTLLYAPTVTVTVDVKEYLDDKDIHVYDLSVNDVVTNIYIGEEGANNFSIVSLSSDSTETDSTSSLPINDIKVDFLHINATDANVRLKQTDYARHLRLLLELPLTGDLNKMHFSLSEALLQINDMALRLNGNIDMPEDGIHLDATLHTEQWDIPTLLALIPKGMIDELLEKIQLTQGSVQLCAAVKGVYNEQTMPLIDADLVIKDLEGSYADLPAYPLRDVQADLSAHIDLNDTTASCATIRNIQASTRNTSIKAQGEVKQLLADIFLDVNAEATTRLSDLRQFVPKNIHGESVIKAKAKAAIALDDLTNMRLQNGKITGDIRLTKTDLSMGDSLHLNLPKADLTFAIPNRQPTKSTLSWLNATVKLSALEAEMIGTGRVDMGSTSLHLQAGDILSKNPLIFAAVDLNSDALSATADSIEAKISAPQLSAYIEYNTKDTTVMPVVQAHIDFGDLKAIYKEIDAHLTQSALSASLSGGRKDKSAPRLKADLETQKVVAKIGSTIRFNGEQLHLGAAARYNKEGTNILLQWNPRLSIRLKKALAIVPQLALPVNIPSIDFDYSNRLFSIREAQVQLGRSDFALSGEVKDIGKWMREEGVLEGELNFTSEFTDINQMMSLLSSDTAEDEATTSSSEENKNNSTTPTSEKEEPSPFLVPRNVNVALNTHIKKAEMFNEKLSDLKGKLYVNDGVLVLEEMGFVCKAAKLQLTAMYRTPRRNDLYVGLDYHMLDVDIEELIEMIPQLDSMMPMLRSFKGDAEFHLAAETYLKADYSIKYSTLRGACSLSGKNLTVLDSETFTKISKLLMFNKKTENKIDSLNAEITVYKKEIDVYPLCVSLDNYMVALGGRHNLDMTFNYDINVLSPLYLGVNVTGKPDDLDIKLAPCKFAKDFRPIFHGKVDTQSAELRQLIRDSMRKNVKIK